MITKKQNRQILIEKEKNIIIFQLLHEQIWKEIEHELGNFDNFLKYLEFSPEKQEWIFQAKLFKNWCGHFLENFKENYFNNKLEINNF